MAFRDNEAEFAELRLQRSLKVLRHEIGNLTEERRMPIDIWVSERFDRVISRLRRMFSGRLSQE
jgi:hypothetical protein